MPWAIAVAAALLLWAAFAWNRLVSLRNRKREAWSGVEVQLKRRHDLVPNLVAVVRGYAKHEQETFVAVAGEREMTERLVTLFALVERYPELRADANFRRLHGDLVEIEDDLQHARRYHNAVVRDLNTTISSFPTLLLARPLGFREEPFFEVESAAERLAQRITW